MAPTALLADDKLSRATVGAERRPLLGALLAGPDFFEGAELPPEAFLSSVARTKCGPPKDVEVKGVPGVARTHAQGVRSRTREHGEDCEDTPWTVGDEVVLQASGG